MFGGQFLHADLFEMAAYLFHLVLNHPFIDGNKRVGLETALLFLEVNGFSVDTIDDLLVDLVLRTARAKQTSKRSRSFSEIMSPSLEQSVLLSAR